MYATPTELASYLQKDLDTSSATQALTLASADFAGAANTAFESTAVTYQTEGSSGGRLVLPFQPIIAVSAVRVAGVTVTDYTRIGQIMYRLNRWGGWVFPPALVEVDLTHGYTSVRDDVKLAVLEIAGGIYENPTPTGIASETIDDYSVKYNGTPIYPGRPWREVAASYAGVFAT